MAPRLRYVHDDSYKGFKLLLHSLGLPASVRNDPELDLTQTPARAAAGFADMLEGHKNGALGRLQREFTVFPTKGRDRGLVTVSTSFVSVCSHHLLPFHGTLWVGYVPDQKLVGLSKLVRAVDHYSRQLQLQEKLMADLAEFLEAQLSPRMVLLASKATHLCMCARGVRRPDSRTTVTLFRAKPTMPEKKQREVVGEFYTQINLKDE